MLLTTQGENLHDDVSNENEDARQRRLKLMAAVEGDDWSAVIDGQTQATMPDQSKQAAAAAASSSSSNSSSSGTDGQIVSPFSRANVHRKVGDEASRKVRVVGTGSSCQMYTGGWLW